MFRIQGGRKRMRFLGVAVVAAGVCLATSAGAGAGWKGSEPAEPAHDWPSAAGLAGQATKQIVKAIGGAHGVKFGGAQPGGAAPGAVGSTTLVLYDTSGAYGWLGELYATYAGNLASHFGSWKAEPVSAYQAGQISQYTATVYIGSSYDEPLSTAFLDDVYNATHPVVWIYDNIWELTNRYATTFQSKYGWMWSQFDLSPVSNVLYNGVDLTRDAAHNGAGIMSYASVDTTKATVLGTAVRDTDGSSFPWALRSGNLLYVGENPFVYTTETDRVLAFDDLLYSVLNPAAPTRHRALVRLEDINPSQDPVQLKAVADYLYSQGIPFGFGVSPVYTDPNGYYNGTPETSHLSDKGNGIADIVRYMEAHGGTLVMHGYTHQYTNVPNPYTAVTGDDFEFFRVTENTDHTLNFVGPVPEDSFAWASGRLAASAWEFLRAGAGLPRIFEFPHYAASAVDYQAVAAAFPTRWERGLYFGGVLSGSTVDYSHVIGESFPYVVRDAYGSTVLPENLGDYAPEPFYSFPPHGISSILAAGAANLAVRDGFAAFFYHPFEGVGPLSQIIAGLRAQGWTFTSPAQVAATG
ncbi:MAG TPA: DUF2334 domain-containing protein [Gaiellaceae bacterium]|nr:DUF2334 domain-containing protein [Gaiellaceae bacterium]